MINPVAHARFKPGDAVRVDDRESVGHCRAPRYLRGRTGVVAEVLGNFRDPERLAYHLPGLPRQVLYKVRFKQSALWPDYAGPSRDRLDADITENWLAAAAPALRKATRRKVPTHKATKSKANT